MKTLAICLLIALSYAQQINFTENMTIALESGIIQGLYLAAEGKKCLNIHEGRCGKVFGTNPLNVANLSGNDLNNILKQQLNIHWIISKSEDFFCLRHQQLNAFLSVEGKSCANLNQNKRCGSINLHKLKDIKCTRDFGWRINLVQNFYILQSVKYQNVYLLLNGQACQQLRPQATQPIYANVRVGRNLFAGVPGCGHPFAFHLMNTQNLQSNNQYKWALFNIRQIQ
jgi:hypothetical protein